MPTDKLPMAENPDFTFEGQGWNQVTGRSHVAFTNRGRPFRAFVPDMGNPENEKYFCHGHTFDTYRQWHYSPFSGLNNVGRIIEDEYAAVPGGLTGLHAGDVVTWSQGVNIIHSSLVINVPGGPTTANVTVWTKNGRMLIAVAYLQQVNTLYAPAIPSYWRAI